VLDEHARQAGSACDERTIDARRSDALVDLVLDPTGMASEVTNATREDSTDESSGVSGGVRDEFHAADTISPAGCQCQCGRCRRGGGVDIRVTIPYTALLGADELPGDLAGYGPIPAAVARDLAAGGTWRRILTDPASGRRRHHQVKQSPSWSVTQHPDGCTTWRTPSGHNYHSQPPPLTDPEPLTTRPISDPADPPPF